MRSVRVRCPVCGERITLREIPDVGDVIYCDECDSVLEVISSDPLKVREVTERDSELDEDEDEY